MDGLVGRREKANILWLLEGVIRRGLVGQPCPLPTLSAPPFFLVARLVTQF